MNINNWFWKGWTFLNRGSKYRRVHWCKNRVYSESGSGPRLVRSKQRRAIDRTGLFQEQWGCTEWDRMWLYTPHPQVFLWLLWPVSVVHLCHGEENRSKLPTFCVIEPLPGLLAALAALSVRWFSLYSVTSDSDSLCCIVWSGTLSVF